MASAVVVPLSEYLSTTYHPDRDFLEGELKERNMGEQPHSRVQSYFSFIFRQNLSLWSVRPLTEQRVQVRAERYRIPDVCVIARTQEQERILRTPPLLCIEVLSSDDTLGEMQRRVDDYIHMGVSHIWIVDPWKRIAYEASARGFLQPEDGVLRIAGTPVAITLAEVFAELDEA